MNNQHNLLNLSRRTFVKNMSLGALSIPLSTMTDHSLYEDKKLGVALVGLGRYALKLAEGIELSKYCKLTGIVTDFIPPKLRNGVKNIISLQPVSTIMKLSIASQIIKISM